MRDGQPHDKSSKGKNMKLFAKKTPKYTFKEQKKEPEISSPLEFQLAQWFKLRKWIGGSYNIEHQEKSKVQSNLLINFPKFFSVTDKVHANLSMMLRRGGKEKEHRIVTYYADISNDSLGGLADKPYAVRYERSDLLKIADPSNFEFWINYDSG